MALIFFSKYIDHAFIELTSRCNLRCVYCAVSQPSYKGEDFDLSHFESIIRELKRTGTRFLNINGHGETTLIKGWHQLSNTLVDDGFKLSLITNLSRKLLDEEIETLSKFESITVSCDTVDPQLFTKLRRHAKLETLFNNVDRIQAVSKKIGRKVSFNLSVVVSDASVFGLPEVVREGLKRDIYNFSFLELTKYAPISDGLNVKSISELPSEKFTQAIERIEEAKEIALKSGGVIDVSDGLRLLLLKNNEKKVSLENLKKDENVLLTKDCFFPWSTLFFKSTGEVAPCCWHPPLGKISNETPLKVILKNDLSSNLKKSILSGQHLSKACKNCPKAEWITVEKFKKKFKRHLYLSIFDRGRSFIWQCRYSALGKRIFNSRKTRNAV